MQTIITSLPVMADSITADVLDPLGDWFGQDNRTNLLGTLASPIEDTLIAPATDTVDALTSLDTSYQTDLVTPVQWAINERAAIRVQIEEQRAQIGDLLLAARRDRPAA